MSKPWLSKAAAQLREQIDDSYPDRKRQSDGWNADANHKRRGKSDHIPDPKANFVVNHCDRWRDWRDVNCLDDWLEYERIFNGESTLTFDGTTLTVTGNEIITGNLTVQGTASFQNTTNLEVADRFVLFASGSNTAGDGGIVIQQGTQNVGELYGYDSATNRWAFTSSFTANGASFTPAAYITTTEVSTAVPSAAPLYGGASGHGNIYVKTDTGDIYIYA